VLKADGDTAVYRATVLGRDVVLKRWDLRTPGARAKAMLAASRGHRHWRGAARLERAGIRTARCLALAFEQREIPRVWLAMEHLEGRSLLEHMAHPDPSLRTQHAIAGAAGALVAALCRAKLYNRDLKPSNLIVLDGPTPSLGVIDCVAIRRSGSPERLARMLSALATEPTGCRVLPRRVLLVKAIDVCRDSLGPFQAVFSDERTAKHHWTRQLIRRVQILLAAHGDPRPKVNPLAPPAPANP
jgi:tRNA A-37 threonylcarbamoyl transferase component Bud32